jgi:hypothetical protein
VGGFTGVEVVGELDTGEGTAEPPSLSVEMRLPAVEVRSLPAAGLAARRRSGPSGWVTRSAPARWVTGSDGNGAGSRREDPGWAKIATRASPAAAVRPRSAKAVLRIRSGSPRPAKLGRRSEASGLLWMV